MSKVKMKEYNRPESLQQLLSLLDHQENPPCFLAGATDYISQMRLPSMSGFNVVDICLLQGEFNYISLDNEGLHIGSMATHSQIASDLLVLENAEVLACSVSEIGSPQIRNRGTLGGNIGNASPAGDSMPALLILDAQVKLLSLKGERSIPLSEFIVAPSETVIKANEIIKEIIIPKEALGMKGCFRKIGTRNALAISIVSMAMCMDSNDEIRMAFGSVAPYPIRFKQLETLCVKGDYKALSKAVQGTVSPISDIRATADYRREMTINLIYWGLCQLGAMQPEEVLIK